MAAHNDARKDPGQAFMQEVEALERRRRYPAGALRPMMEPVGRPEDPVQRIVKNGEQLFLTIREAAELTRVSDRTITNLIKAGDLRACRFGKQRTLIPITALSDLVRDWSPQDGDPEEMGSEEASE